jgi:hypothetical protein
MQSANTYERDPDSKICGWYDTRLFKLMFFERLGNAYTAQLFECVEIDEELAEFYADPSLVGQIAFVCRGNYILKYGEFFPKMDDKYILDATVGEYLKRLGGEDE